MGPKAPSAGAQPRSQRRTVVPGSRRPPPVATASRWSKSSFFSRLKEPPDRRVESRLESGEDGDGSCVDRGAAGVGEADATRRGGTERPGPRVAQRGGGAEARRGL